MGQNLIVTSPKNIFDVDQLHAALDEIFQDYGERGTERNLVFFIHGRGKQPEKGIKRHLPHIEGQYGAKVIMFRWVGAYDGIFGFPKIAAQKAAGDLYKTIQLLEAYKGKYPDRFSSLNLSFLTHSMGSIVFEEMIREHHKTLPVNLFDTILLSSPASESEGHAHWADRVNVGSHLYITLNRKDRLLKWAQRKEKSARLGQRLRGYRLSQRAQYIDLSLTGVGHRYYVAERKKNDHTGQKHNPYIASFYHQIVNGQSVDLETFDGIKRIVRNRIYVFKKAIAEQ